MRFRRTHSHSPTLSPRVGTGIGLALVKEFVRQHGGSVRVESTVGKGSMFVVTIPTTADHLPKDRVASGSQVAADAIAAPYLLEASHWDLPKRSAQGVDTVDGSSGASSALNNAPGARILIADDNADMREYLVRLLAPRWTVDVVEDGQAALEAALQHPPDLVLSDVMMPRMDGVALLQSLRADPRTNTIPILLLSARAGEEAVVGGLETGADDYLVKPFSARELITRVGTHLQMARVRRAASEAARELAETRAALLADLERKNDGLEAFSHSVSHDLRAPLRRIDGFIQMLLKDHAERLDAQGRDYLQRMRVAAQRMAELIDDLLKLSRVERADLHREPVDLSRLGRRIADSLGKSDLQRNVEVVIADDLVCDADGRLFEVVLENLLGNAWKFTANTSSARVELGSIEKNGDITFYVKDNGAGFDQAYARRLFTPFQRLHSEREFPGTGIGLATVRRIIERHGGRVWAEGTVGGGATVHWTLPAKRDSA